MNSLIDSNEATIHHAIERADCDAYRMIVSNLADLVEAVRDGDTGMILATARELADDFEGVMHSEGFTAALMEQNGLVH